MTPTTTFSAVQQPLRQRRWALALLAGAAAFSMMMAHTAAQAQSAPQAVKLTVNGMVCAFCAQGIEARLKKMPETADLYINLKQKVVAVQAKPGQTLAIDKIRAEVTDAGYEVSQVQPLTQTVAELRNQMRGKP
jgi:periplasmic mercuric ion binding protein